MSNSSRRNRATYIHRMETRLPYQDKVLEVLLRDYNKVIKHINFIMKMIIKMDEISQKNGQIFQKNEPIFLLRI